MTGREQFNFEEQKRRIMAERGGVCEVCGKPGTQLAHRIPKTNHNLESYGRIIIHHPLNLALVCSLDCNSRVIIVVHSLELLGAKSEGNKAPDPEEPAYTGNEEYHDTIPF